MQSASRGHNETQMQVNDDATLRGIIQDSLKKAQGDYGSDFDLTCSSSRPPVESIFSSGLSSTF